MFEISSDQNKMSCEKCGRPGKGQYYGFVYGTRNWYPGYPETVKTTVVGSAGAFICDRCVTDRVQFPRWLAGFFAVVFLTGLLKVPSTFDTYGLEATLVLIIFCVGGFLVCARIYYRSRKWDEEYYRKAAIQALRVNPNTGSDLAIQSVRKKYEKMGYNNFWTPSAYKDFQRCL
jgi:hypothetical protein